MLTHFGLWRLGLAAAETQTTEAERDCLARHAKGRLRLAEIGVWHGVTTCRLKRAMALEGILFAIDPYPVGRLRFSFAQIIARSEVSRTPGGSVVWIRQTGARAAQELAAANSDLFDFVFIDGDHTYEGLRSDWEGWSNLIAPSGIVALHDSRPTPSRKISDAGSVRFTRDVIHRDQRFDVIDTTDSLTVLQCQPVNRPLGMLRREPDLAL